MWITNKIKKVLKIKSTTINGKVLEDASKFELEFNYRYKKLLKTRDIHIFHANALNLINNLFEKSDYAKYKVLLKEIQYFSHHIFLIIQDDFFIGDNVLKNRLTKIDNYIFSQYRKDERVSNNIKKLIKLGFSNRFDKEARANLFAYFVFIEETGIEFTSILKDYYSILESDKKELTIMNRFFKKNYLKKSYLKQNVIKEETMNSVSTNTFRTMQPSIMEDVMEVKRQIYQEKIKLSE